jgi:hypothetical protein
LASSKVATRLSVRRFSGLLGKCSAQNHRRCSGPLSFPKIASGDELRSRNDA